MFAQLQKILLTCSSSNISTNNIQNISDANTLKHVSTPIVKFENSDSYCQKIKSSSSTLTVNIQYDK